MKEDPQSAEEFPHRGCRMRRITGHDLKHSDCFFFEAKGDNHHGSHTQFAAGVTVHARIGFRVLTNQNFGFL